MEAGKKIQDSFGGNTGKVEGMPNSQQSWSEKRDLKRVEILLSEDLQHQKQEENWDSRWARSGADDCGGFLAPLEGVA